MNYATIGISLLCQGYSWMHAGICLPAHEIVNYGEYGIEQTVSVVLTVLTYFFASQDKIQHPKSQVC